MNGFDCKSVSDNTVKSVLKKKTENRESKSTSPMSTFTKTGDFHLLLTKIMSCDTSYLSGIDFTGFDVAKTGDARIGFVGKLHSMLRSQTTDRHLIGGHLFEAHSQLWL